MADAVRKPLAAIQDITTSPAPEPEKVPALAEEGDPADALDLGEMAAVEGMGMTPEQGLALRDFINIVVRKRQNTVK